MFLPSANAILTANITGEKLIELVDVQGNKFKVTISQLTEIFESGNVLAANRRTVDYTLVLTDKDKLVELNKATAIVLTVPTNATVAFPVGTVIPVVSLGAGQGSVAAAGGVTILSENGALKLNRYKQGVLVKIATNTWYLFGVASHRTYKAAISQASTAAPSVTIFENSIGTIVWARTSAGVYTGTLSGAFLANKVFFPGGDVMLANEDTVSIARTSNNVVTITTNDDDVLTGFNLEIQVFE